MKNEKESMIFELTETCNFGEVFEHCSKAPDALSSDERPDAQIGYVRGYYDGYSWCGDYFPCRNHLYTEAFRKESRDIFSCLTTQFRTLDVLRRFCEAHPSAKIGKEEYNFFMNGHAADYWIRFITRERDYNLYLNAYAKEL